MATHRLIHREAGQGERSSSLSDFEYRVWVQYMLSADDFGVCPADAVRFQADNHALAIVPARKVSAAIARLVAVDLVRRFDHQGHGYLYQWDWQDWQSVKYPTKTQHPCPPAEILGKLSSKTSALFSQFHPKVPQKFASRAYAGSASANANADGEPEREKPARRYDAETLWDRWLALAAAHGAKQVAIAGPRVWSECLKPLLATYTDDELDRALTAWWASPHTGGRNIGLFRSQAGEVLEHLKRGGTGATFRAPRGTEAQPVGQNQAWRQRLPPPSADEKPTLTPEQAKAALAAGLEKAQAEYRAKAERVGAS